MYHEEGLRVPVEVMGVDREVKHGSDTGNTHTAMQLRALRACPGLAKMGEEWTADITNNPSWQHYCPWRLEVLADDEFVRTIANNGE